MSSHRINRRNGWFTSVRVRALLALGVALGVGATGTFAFWTDDVVISGTTFTAGTLDLQVDNVDTVDNASGTLSMAGMVPGNTSAQVLTVKNNGTAPLKYTLVGNLTGTDAALYNSTASLNLVIKTGATKSGTGNASTCDGGTAIQPGITLTSTSATILAKRPTAALIQNATEALCFQVTFSASANTSLQGKSATATFTAQGTSDVS